MPEKLDSYVVHLYGLDGKREHWMPGNRKRGLGPREKKPFDTEEEAKAFLVKHGHTGFTTYQCSICHKWHTASPPRR